jgi:biopolymer transport protein ExbB/TolQ
VSQNRSREHRSLWSRLGSAAAIIHLQSATAGSGKPVKADIEAAKLASERAAAILHLKMGRGRASLAAIASSAALVGLLATTVAMTSAFHESGCFPVNAMAMVADNLSEAIIPTAAGLAVATVASWCHGYLCADLDTLDTETRAATLELANFLSRLRQRD